MITAVAVEIKRKANKTGNESPKDRTAGTDLPDSRDSANGVPGSGHRSVGIRTPDSRASGRREAGFRNGTKKQRPLRFTPETAFIHSITIQLLKRYAGSSHLST